MELVAFLSHLHWDHIIGLPFFTTAHNPGTTLEVYGPPQVGGSLHDLFDRVLHPPFFPINVEELQGSVRFNEALHDEVEVGNAEGDRPQGSSRRDHSRISGSRPTVHRSCS